MVHGMKTATQTSLIRHYEDEFKQKDLMREQLKQEEKKIDYSASSQSKQSVLGKQVSQGSKQNDMISKQYASNPSNAIFIADSEQNYSMNSDIKNKQLLSKRSSQSKIDQSLILPHDIHSNGEIL